MEVSEDEKGEESESFNVSLTNFFRQLSWQDWAFITFLFLSQIYVTSIVARMNWLPGPLYGGDIFFHFGNIMHLYNGGSIFKSSHYLNEWQHYPWLCYLLVWLFIKLFTIDPLRADILFPIIIFSASLIVNYILGEKVFKQKDIALLFTIASASLPTTTPTSLSSFVLLPLMLLTFFLLFKKEFNAKSSLIAGIIYGIMGIGHVAAFLSINLLMVLMLAVELISGRTRGNILKKYVLAFAVGIPIALLYWAPLIVFYHGKTLNPWQEYAFYGVQGEGKYISETLKNTFIDLSSIPQTIISALVMFTIVWFIIKRKINWPLLLVFLTGFIGLTHPYITMPLLHTSFGYYGFAPVLSLFRMLMAFYALSIIYNYAEKSKILLGALAIFFLTLFILNLNQSLKSQSNTLAMAQLSDLQKGQLEMAYYVRSVVLNNETILTPHEETSFAINALTGKKVVFMRRTHASPFVNFDQRAADAAVIMYGNNSALKMELIKKYNVRYFYYDYFTITNSKSCLQMWENFSNPAYWELSYSCMRVLPQYEEYLKENGIETKKVYARLDIAFQDAPRTELVIIKPGPINLPTKLLKNWSYANFTYYAFYKLEW
ncbi:MAG: hypothetical protein QXW07_04475 [Candidatus Woesearchaeota archaeon]